MIFAIQHSNGRCDSGYESLAAAVAQLRADYDHVEWLTIETDADGTVARDDEDTADHAYLARVVEVAS